MQFLGRVLYVKNLLSAMMCNSAFAWTQEIWGRSLSHKAKPYSALKDKKAVSLELGKEVLLL